MNAPRMLAATRVAPDTHLLPSWMPVPGLGMLAVNAGLIDGPEPVLVDTGLAALREDFLATLSSVIEPARLRWIWITHTDPDHIGNLAAVLALAPQARVATNFLGMGKLGLLQLPADRVHLLNPGQSLSVGDRELRAVQPPVYDAPESMGLFDCRSGALFSADCFGAVLPAPAAAAADVPTDTLREGMALWAGVDAPWLGEIDPALFAARLMAVRALEPDIVIGSHLPPARGMLHTLLHNLTLARTRPAFRGPDQAALEAMLRQRLHAA